MEQIYIAIDYSINEQTGRIDANANGWKALYDSILHILEDKKDINLRNKEHGGIIDHYDAGAEYIKIDSVLLKHRQSRTAPANLQAVFNKSNYTMTIIGSDESYNFLLSLIFSLLNYKGRFPADISLMSEIFGGGRLTNNLIRLGPHDYSIEHLRLFRWI